MGLIYYMYMLQNPYYLFGTIFVLIAMVFSAWAQFKIRSTYSTYKRVPNSRGLTGAQVAREILDANGMYNVPVYQVAGELTDHFDPTKKLINLSTDIYNGTSIAAVAVAAHECGHAIQFKTGYAPLTFRNMIVPVCNIGNYFGWIAIMVGLIFGYPKLAWIGFILSLGILVFQVVTLPVELDASRRGLEILQARYLTSNEYDGAKAMLSSAAMTYVASVAATLASMLRILLVIMSSSRRR